MKYSFTEKTVIRYIDRSATNFYRSNVQEYKKRVLENLLPCLSIEMSSKLKTTWGQAYTLGTHEKRVDKMNLTVSPVELTGLSELYYIVLAVNTRVLQWAKPQDNFDTVSHELAHCLDFVLRGDSFHDEYWRELTIAMGGSGSTLSHIKVPKYVYEKDVFNQPHLRKGHNDVYGH